MHAATGALPLEGVASVLVLRREASPTPTLLFVAVCTAVYFAHPPMLQANSGAALVVIARYEMYMLRTSCRCFPYGRCQEGEQREEHRRRARRARPNPRPRHHLWLAAYRDL